MKKLVAKMRKVKMTRWNKLTTGEKVMKVVMFMVKAALFAALVAVVGAVVLGLVVGFAVMNAVAGGFKNAANAYNSGDRYVRFR